MDLLGVAGADAAAGGAEFVGDVAEVLEGLLAEFILGLVVGGDDVGAVGDDEAGGVDLAGGEEVEFLDEFLGIDDDAVGDDGGLARVEDAGGDQGEGLALAGHDDGMAGVGAAVVADDGVVVGGEEVNGLALAFIAPLEADDGGGVWRGSGFGGGDRRHEARRGRGYEDRSEWCGRSFSDVAGRAASCAGTSRKTLTLPSPRGRGGEDQAGGCGG